MLVGSEGALGVIVEAWVRVQPRPTHRRSAGVRFADFAHGAECVRALAQSGLNPSNCRLIDPREARMTMAGDGSRALLVLGFESSDHPVDGSMERALELCASTVGRRVNVAAQAPTVQARAARAAVVQVAGVALGAARPRATARERPARTTRWASWREAFLRAPYLRDVFVAMGVISETFETAITWERFPAFHAAGDGGG